MRILFISSGLAPEYGGSALSESSLAATLSGRLGVETICPAERLRESFARALGVPGARPFDAGDALRAWRGVGWLADSVRRADVVHVNGHWRWDNACLTALCRKLGKPYLLHPRGMCLVGHRRARLKRVWNLILGNAIVRGASRIIALSQYEVSQLEPYGVRDKVLVVPNGIRAPEKWRPTPRPKDRPPYFLYLGRIESRKNLVFLVHAFAEYRRAGGTHELTLMGPVEKGYDDAVRAAIREEKLEAVATLAQPQYDDGKWNALSWATAVIYPSHDEPFGRVPFETLAAGSIPVVPSDSGGAEYLRPFLPDSLYRQDDRASLAGVLTRIERAKPDIGPARRWVAETLDWNRIADRVIELYRSVSGVEETRHADSVSHM